MSPDRRRRSPPDDVEMTGLKVAMFTDDGFFPVSPAVRRAVEEAAQALLERGAIVEPFQPPDVEEMMRIYVGLLTAIMFRRLRLQEAVA